jgi:hypothetical protein
MPPFDRTLVLDLFGLPVPTLCLERRWKDNKGKELLMKAIQRSEK